MRLRFAQEITVFWEHKLVYSQILSRGHVAPVDFSSSILDGLVDIIDILRPLTSKSLRSSWWPSNLMITSWGWDVLFHLFQPAGWVINVHFTRGLNFLDRFSNLSVLHIIFDTAIDPVVRTFVEKSIERCYTVSIIPDCFLLQGSARKHTQ